MAFSFKAMQAGQKTLQRGRTRPQNSNIAARNCLYYPKFVGEVPLMAELAGCSPLHSYFCLDGLWEAALSYLRGRRDVTRMPSTAGCASTFPNRSDSQHQAAELEKIALCRTWECGEQQSTFYVLLDPLVPVLPAGLFICLQNRQANSSIVRAGLGKQFYGGKTLGGYLSLPSPREIISIL